MFDARADHDKHRRSTVRTRVDVRQRRLAGTHTQHTTIRNTVPPVHTHVLQRAAVGRRVLRLFTHPQHLSAQLCRNLVPLFQLPLQVRHPHPQPIVHQLQCLSVIVVHAALANSKHACCKHPSRGSGHELPTCRSR